MSDKSILETEKETDTPDPEARSIKDRRVITNPYDLAVDALLDQIKANTLFLRPVSERPNFQRNYVWSDKLASRLVESILLNVPIPPCYLSQNEDFELDVIDGQQRIFSIYRFCDNQFKLSHLEMIKELNGMWFHELPPRVQRQIKTHTIRCVLISNESHPDVKFDVFQRLNTSTVPLNAQELRNCMFRGPLNELLVDCAKYEPWLKILNRKAPDKRMKGEELALRFFAFYLNSPDKYYTPLRSWLNATAKEGKKFSEEKIQELYDAWRHSIDVSRIWFQDSECFRRPFMLRSGGLNRALFDLVMNTASKVKVEQAQEIKDSLRSSYGKLFEDFVFEDLISRAVDHKSRTAKRFALWTEKVNCLID